MLKIKLLENKIFKIKMSCIFPKIVLANMQEKEVIPTKEPQEILPDKNFDGLSKVIVSKISDEYIIPSGNLEISQNGTFDVCSKENVIVNIQPNLQEKTITVTQNGTYNVVSDDSYDALSKVKLIANIPEKKIGTKTITENGIYNANDDNLDGYSQVNVSTNGVDINDYFSQSVTYMVFNLRDQITKIPIIDTKNWSNFSGGFSNFRCLVSMPELDFSNATEIGGMLDGDTNLVNLGGFKNLGKSYKTAFSAGTSSYKLVLSHCTKLTEESLINVLTKLYDIKTAGCKSQTISLGSTNLAKLTSDAGKAALTQAQLYGWNVI